jgi:hypothetical protein
MKCRYAYAAGGGLLFTLACGSKVEIGHGGVAGTAGAAGSLVTAGAGGTSEQAPGDGGEGPVAIGGEGQGPSGGSSPVGGKIPEDDGPQAEVAKVDLLLAVDNSRSMAEKQRLLAKSMPDLVKRLVSPHCVNSAGAIVTQPSSADQACPAGSAREFAPLRDLHIGVITSSLGSHGAKGVKDVCVSAGDNDHAHLLPLVRPDLPSYDGKGFVKWDPNGLANPPGESDLQAFADSVETMITSAGETGCGFEAQLESVYRFLVDPEPPQSVLVADGQSTAVKVGVDTELLEQRANFLRPDSSVVVLMLTDENDCSIQDDGYGWLIARAAPLFRSTSACHTNPNDACCQSCGETSANPGCGEISADSECQKGMTFADQDRQEDELNLRCLNQKGRFGFDLLYPTARYVSGFGDGTVPNRAGELVPNPLFHQGKKSRDRSLFTLAVVGGVPWQDLATGESLAGETLEYMTPEALQSSNRWPVLMGDPAKNQPPSDPFMRESVEARSGKNPIINASIVPNTSLDPTANPINGHEQETFKRDLQYACTFELPTPIACDLQAEVNDIGCDCYEADLSANRPVCQPPEGGPASSTQYYGKAYPALRELAVARELGRRTVLGSVCARNTQDDTRSDYGYRPMFSALGRRIAQTLVKPQ